MAGQDTPRAGGPRRLLRYLPIAAIALLFAVGLLGGWQQYLTLDRLVELREVVRQFASDFGMLAAVGFVLAYAAAVAVAFPATWLLTVTGAAIFGLVGGAIFATIGATMGATALFLAARTAFGDLLRKSARRYVAKVSDGFERNAFNYLLALRLAPVVPFALVNVLPALFKVSLPVFVGATLLGVLPGAFVYASIGAGLDDVVNRSAASGRDLTLADLISPALLLGLLGLAALALLPILVRSILAHWSTRKGVRRSQAKSRQSEVTTR